MQRLIERLTTAAREAEAGFPDGTGYIHLWLYPEGIVVTASRRHHTLSERVDWNSIDLANINVLEETVRRVRDNLIASTRDRPTPDMGEASREQNQGGR